MGTHAKAYIKQPSTQQKAYLWIPSDGGKQAFDELCKDIQEWNSQIQDIQDTDPFSFALFVDDKHSNWNGSNFQAERNDDDMGRIACTHVINMLENGLISSIKSQSSIYDEVLWEKAFVTNENASGKNSKSIGKKQLYENIMANVAKHVKNVLNESAQSATLRKLFDDVKSYGRNLADVLGGATIYKQMTHNIQFEKLRESAVTLKENVEFNEKYQEILNYAIHGQKVVVIFENNNMHVLGNVGIPDLIIANTYHTDGSCDYLYNSFKNSFKNDGVIGPFNKAKDHIFDKLQGKTLDKVYTLYVSNDETNKAYHRRRAKEEEDSQQHNEVGNRLKRYKEMKQMDVEIDELTNLFKQAIHDDDIHSLVEIAELFQYIIKEVKWHGIGPSIFSERYQKLKYYITKGK